MKVCKYIDSCGERCMKADCPICPGYCPVPDIANVCRFEERIWRQRTMRLVAFAAEDDDRKFYYDIDGIRLVFEDDELAGWYCLDGPMEGGLGK